MKLLSILSIVKEVGPSIKSWIFADGKFSRNRAITLIGALALLCAAIYFVGAENVAIAVDMLDDVSDIIGYEE